MATADPQRLAITCLSTQTAELKTDLLAIPCAADTLADDPTLTTLNEALGGALRSAIADERFVAKAGQTLCLHTQGRTTMRRLLLVGVGARAAFDGPAVRTFAARAARAGATVGTTDLALRIPAALLQGPSLDLASVAQLSTEGVLLGTYHFDKYLTLDRDAPRALRALQLVFDTPTPDLTLATRRGYDLALAVARARDLVNEPASYLTPTQLAAIARDIAEEHHLEISVLGPKECKEQGMGLFLAVAQGSEQEPRFIHLAWRPAGAKHRILLVGKGVTFDSGGLSLKTNDGMLDMKTDMAGAAAVISSMSAIASQRLCVEVHALAACTENMPSGRSYKLGDVLRSKAGKTVEINNTDAEGRLTLADALAYGLALAPTAIIDFATLTGACMVALGPHIAGVMGNNQALTADWLAAAAAVGEDMWQLPLPERLAEQLKSEVADMKNTGERWGGALTAGLFLKEFVGNTPWVHVDLAGPSTSDKDFAHMCKGGTGFAVLTIFEYLRRLSQAQGA